MADVYILTGGRHIGPGLEEPEGGGEAAPTTKTYEKGDRVESERRLDLIFPNKFVREDASRSGKQVSPARKKQIDQIIKSEDSGWDEDDRPMLEAMTPKRFAKTAKDAGVEAEEDDEEEKPAKAAGKPLAKSNLGEDVSGDFPSAEAKNLRVFKSAAGKFQVARKTGPNHPVNDKALESDKDVKDFIEKHKK